MTIQVTIAIPVYNADKYLRDAIQSVVNQTYKDWILYLINDGSTDSSLKIMQEFASLDSRIKVINDGCNKGLIARLNQSIVLANSKYYARMDADDIMYLTRIEEQVRFLEKHSGIDLVGSSIMTIDDENNIVGSGYYTGLVHSFVHPSVMGRTKWFKNNLYAQWPMRAEDKELWLRTSSKSNFYAIGRPLLFYREFGIPTFKKYYATQKTLLRIYANYKRYDKSVLWCVNNYMFTVSKIIFSALFALFGMTELVVKMRTRHSVPFEMLLTSEDLTKSIS